ncbi:30S ribosomal protein S6 [uncultured Gimesia sp.]|uniref:30S ribosomal protein S6 n=1 Tax=uncultured Gimesia sp. TaxID=1678688 RepID=UPI002601EB74|nr:30S ribosomal protein S6 [uncultured Gimesia sp.]
MSVAEKKVVSANYEGMFLLDSGKFAADHEGTIAHLMEILEKAGAEVVAHRPWQDGKLAYPIEGHMKGLHYLVYFTMPGKGMDLVTRACHLSDIVIRQLVINQPQSLFDAMVAAIDPAVEAADPVAVVAAVVADEVEDLETPEFDAIADVDDED